MDSITINQEQTVLTRNLLDSGQRTEQQMAQQTLQQREEERRRQAGMTRQAEAPLSQEARLARLQYRIVMPQKTVANGRLPQVSTNIRSAGKRRTRSRMLGSELRRKRLNAEQLDGTGQQWEDTVNKRKQAAVKAAGDETARALENMSRLDRDAICQFLTEGENQNRDFLQKITQGGEEEKEALRDCLRQFMDMDLNLDLSSDKAFAEQGLKMEEISQKTAAMERLMGTKKDFFDGLEPEEKEDLKQKLGAAERIRDYYQIQKRVITNPYYRTHYRSEISVRYNQNDTPEQRNLAIMQQQAEVCRLQKEMTGTPDTFRVFSRYQPGNADRAVNERQAGSDNPMSREYFNRNLPYTHLPAENSVHIAFFREHENHGDTLYQRLSAQNYRIAGTEGTMAEAFDRSFVNLSNWRAVQNMPIKAVERMFNNLAATPGEGADQEEIRDCRDRNINGLKQYKALMRKQMGFLKRKYGCGYFLMSPEEMVEHRDDYDKDFTNMQGLDNLIRYMKQLPKEFGLFDENDPADQELERLASFYHTECMTENAQRAMYIAGQNPTYEDYKFQCVVSATTKDNVHPEIEMRDSMHPDVRWQTPMELPLQDVLRQIRWLDDMPQLKNEMDSLYGAEGQKDVGWNMLFTELRGMTGVEAARELIDGGMEEQFQDAASKRSQYTEWQNNAAAVCGRIRQELQTLDSDESKSMWAQRYRQLANDLLAATQYYMAQKQMAGNTDQA